MGDHQREDKKLNEECRQNTTVFTSRTIPVFCKMSIPNKVLFPLVFGKTINSVLRGFPCTGIEWRD